MLRTLCPRTSPSVPSIAIVLTMFSPKCCATSSTRRIEFSRTSKAVKIGGNPSSNLTSTTAPMTWQTLPIAPAPVNSSVIFPLGPPDPFAGGGEGAAAEAAEVAYSTARLRRNPFGEGREMGEGDGALGLLIGGRRKDDLRSDDKILRDAMARFRERGIGFVEGECALLLV